MSDTPTPALSPPDPAPTRLPDILNNDVVELTRKYGLLILLVWQFVVGGIKDSIREVVRDVVREENTAIKKTLTEMEQRIAALERNRP